MWFPVLLTVSVLSRAGELASEQPMQGSQFHRWRMTRAMRTRRGGSGGRHLPSASSVLPDVRVSGTSGKLVLLQLPCQLQFYRWLLATMLQSCNCSFHIWIVLFHFDEEKNGFTETETEGEGRVPNLSAQDCNSIHPLFHSPDKQPLINMSSSLAWYRFFFPSKLQFYLKLNTVPSSLLHLVSAVLGLISSLSFLEEQWRVVF